MKKVLSDFLYNALYQLFIIITPILTMPFLSRILGVKALGINSYTFSVVQILSVLAFLGIGQLGIRNIAKNRESQNKVNETFWGLWLIQFLAGIVVIGIYIFYIVNVNEEYRMYFLLQLPVLLGVIFDISWFYIGIERIKQVVLRNMLIKSVSIILIFILIRSENDLWKYMLIMSLGALLGNIVFWIGLSKYVTRFSFNRQYLKDNFRAALLLLIPQLSIQVYITFDKTILGMIAGPVELSYYDQSQKISRIILAVITSLSMVLLPRLANMVVNDQNEILHKYLKKSLDYTIVLALLFCNIVMLNSYEFVPWFFGESFIPMSPLMFWVSLIIIFIPIGGVFANQYALAFEKDKQYVLPLVLGAIISLTLNIIFIPRYGAIGATIVIVAVEFMVCFFRIYLIRKYLDLKFMFQGVYTYFLAALITFIFVYFIPKMFVNDFINMTVKSLVIGTVYIIIIFVLPNIISQDLKRIILKNK
ncbi:MULTISPECIES: oligosaccharide flippase family protein [Bacillus cereus group]|uniref:oligosaccharide flippase family protein n=1 Tax=Bacillus cereus group TaxID=86661 RepID=UPI0010BE7CB5|nr:MULTISPECIES: oligosaccharide flippase family protein [Bacillus cereus group]MBJ8016997.1 oligosaccharide flippase family protein [Bacillus cereus group sp. N34]TKI51559.1 flippase [Bacillus mycoides]